MLANVAPALTKEICAACLAGDTARAAALQLKATPLITALFADVNPIPVKYALNRLGFAAGPCRLPLVSPAAEVCRQVDEAMEGLGLLSPSQL